METITIKAIESNLTKSWEVIETISKSDFIYLGTYILKHDKQKDEKIKGELFNFIENRLNYIFKNENIKNEFVNLVYQKRREIIAQTDFF